LPRSIRPSAASGRERGGRPGSVDRRSTSSGHENRVPWRGGASLAGRSASSRLRAILSIGPRGPPPAVGCFRPLKARERAVRTKAPGASTSERVYGPLRASVKRGEAARRGPAGRDPKAGLPRRLPGDRVGARSPGAGRGGRDLRRSAHAACPAMPDSSRISVGVLTKQEVRRFRRVDRPDRARFTHGAGHPECPEPGIRGSFLAYHHPDWYLSSSEGSEWAGDLHRRHPRSTLGATRPSAPNAHSRAVPRRGGLRGYSLGVSGFASGRRLARPAEPVLFFLSPRRRDARGHLRRPPGGAGGAVNPAPRSGVRGPTTWLRRRRSTPSRRVGDSFF